MKDIMINPFLKFDKDWALVTAGNQDSFNTMTISWGSMGTLWSKPVVTVYVRPERYTYNFLKNAEYFTVTFFDEKYKDALAYLGRVSGRDIDKVKESKLTPVFLENGVTFKEAKETYICQKIYMEQMDRSKMPEFTNHIYGENGQAHYIIVGELKEII